MLGWCHSLALRNAIGDQQNYLSIDEFAELNCAKTAGCPPVA
jgi:hypothetical protein